MFHVGGFVQCRRCSPRRRSCTNRRRTKLRISGQELHSWRIWFFRLQVCLAGQNLPAIGLPIGHRSTGREHAGIQAEAVLKNLLRKPTDLLCRAAMENTCIESCAKVYGVSAQTPAPLCYANAENQTISRNFHLP